jgi:sec-independent protein translocase protein TatA
MLGRLGIGEILFGVGVLVLLFGSKKIPGIARGIGEGIRNFRAGVKSPDQIEKPKVSEDRTPGSERD